MVAVAIDASAPEVIETKFSLDIMLPRKLKLELELAVALAVDILLEAAVVGLPEYEVCSNRGISSAEGGIVGDEVDGSFLIVLMLGNNFSRSSINCARISSNKTLASLTLCFAAAKHQLNAFFKFCITP